MIRCSVGGAKSNVVLLCACAGKMQLWANFALVNDSKQPTKMSQIKLVASAGGRTRKERESNKAAHKSNANEL